MRYPETLPAFSPQQFDRAYSLLVSRVVHMQSGKLEEGDWAYVYCLAKGIPQGGWSNLDIDINYLGLGVEHKMLRVNSVKESYGARLMHPSATRSIRVSSTGDPNEVMRDVLKQYAGLIDTRTESVRGGSPTGLADMRYGWLLWQSDLRDFLYFEEEMLKPDPDEYYAEWHSSGGGSRKQSRNLWIFEKASGIKRFSVTTEAGAKIQLYFDVPSVSDQSAYFFRVQGEQANGVVRLWVAEATERDVRTLLTELDLNSLDEMVGVLERSTASDPVKPYTGGTAAPVELRPESYQTLRQLFPGVSDHEMVQQMVRELRTRYVERR